MMPHCVALVALFALALTPATARGQAVADSATIAAGRAIFEGRGLCATCHGKQGEGVLGPTLQLNSGKRGWLHTDGSTAQIIALINNGVEPTASKSGISMPPKGGARLTELQVAQVAAYVQVLHRTAPPRP